jgi:hypothetical protein
MQQQQKTTTNKQKHEHKKTTKNPQNKIKIIVSNFGHLYFQ